MDLTDEQLLMAAADDPEAFAALYRRHAPRLLAWCARRTGDRDAAADIVAETFAEALEDCHRYTPARGPAAAWLFGIARHLAAQRARRGAVERRALRRLGITRPEIHDADLDRVAALAEAAEVVAALAALPDDQRAAVSARVIEEHEYAQIAAQTASTEAAVRQRVSRGLAALRRALPTTGGDR